MSTEEITPGIEGILDSIHTTFNQINNVMTQYLLNPQQWNNDLNKLVMETIPQKKKFIQQLVERAEKNPTNLVKEHQSKLILQNQDDIRMTKEYAIQEEQIMTNKVLVMLGLGISLGIIITQNSNVLFS
jgi:hypothetical protein